MRNIKLAIVILIYFLIRSVAIGTFSAPMAQANLTKSVLNDLASLSQTDDLLVINVPDSLGGVPVYQNGLEPALRAFQL